MIMLPKRKRFISPGLRQAAHGKTCVLCDLEQSSMPCHLPHNGIGFPAGTGQKVHDWLTGDCCTDCHFKLDHGEWRNDHQMRMKALTLTLQRRFDEGLLVVTGEQHEAVEFLF